MKNTNKVSAQKYLRRRDSFQSPQFSTVIEVNPSCQSEQSMLQKIIYPGRNEAININNCDSKPYKNSVLTERNSNVYEFRKDKILSDKDQNNLKRYESQYCNSQTKRSTFQSQRQSKQKMFSSKPVNIDFIKQNYQSQPQFYQPQKQYYSSSTLIDQQKLQKIQQKIKNHQLKLNNKQNLQVYQPKKRSIHDTMEKQLSKIQIYDSQIKLRKKPTIIDKIKDQKITYQNQNIKLQKTRTFQCEPQAERFTKNAKKCLQTIYDLVLIDLTTKLSPLNINLKNSIKEQIKLVLGPIFADVTIKGKSISKEQFVDKASKILCSYRDQEIEEIFFSIVNGLSKNSKEHENFSRIQETKSVQLTRVPGKLLKNSKTNCQTKQKQRSQENLKNEKQYFSNFQMSQKTISNFKQKRSVVSQIPQRVSKKVYIEQTQKTEPQQPYQSSKQKNTQRYNTRINLNHQTLEIMLNQEKSKRQYQSNLQKKDVYRSKLSNDDDQLERLNNLQKRFNEHFRNKGSV